MLPQPALQTGKRCTKCGFEKHPSDFYYLKSRGAYRSICKACCSDYAKSNKNKEVWREASARWRRNHPTKAALATRGWYQRNREKAIAHADSVRRKNLHHFAAKEAKRRAAKRNATPIWADMSAIAKIYELAKALTESTGIRYAVDHIVPLKSRHVCGLHCEANLRVITHDENQRKGNRHWPDMP